MSNNPSRETMLSLAPLPDPTEAGPNREQYGTGTSPAKRRPRLAPRRRRPYRSEDSESALCVLRRKRPTLPPSEHPLSLTCRRVEPEVIRAVDQASRDSHFRRPRERVERS